MKDKHIDPIANEEDGLDDRYLKGEPDYIRIFWIMVAIILLVLIFYPK